MKVPGPIAGGECNACHCQYADLLFCVHIDMSKRLARGVTTQSRTRRPRAPRSWLIGDGAMVLVSLVIALTLG